MNTARWSLLATALALAGCPNQVVWLGSDHGRNDAGIAGRPAMDAGGIAGATAVDAGGIAGATAVDAGGIAGATPVDSGVTGASPAMDAGGGMMDGGAGTGGGASTEDAPILPTPQEQCPRMVTGLAAFLGVEVQLWVGTPSPMRQGPVVIYWHGTGSSGAEAEPMLGSAVIADIMSQGGVIAALNGSTGTGANTSGTGTFTLDDYAIADEIVGCASEQLNIDPRRIYTAGCSSGGLQAGAMLTLRSSYIAAGVTNSGGLLWISPMPPQDAHAPAVMTMHGAPERDVVVVSFVETSASLVDDIVGRGGFAVNCDHGGGHCGATAPLRPAAWQFLLDHPFGVTPEPYRAGLPATFPSFCAVQ